MLAVPVNLRIEGLLRMAKYTNHVRLRKLQELKILNSWETILTFPTASPCGNYSCIPIIWPMLEIGDWTGWTLGLSQGASVGQSNTNQRQGAGQLTGTAFTLRALEAEKALDL